MFGNSKNKDSRKREVVGNRIYVVSNRIYDIQKIKKVYVSATVI